MCIFTMKNLTAILISGGIDSLTAAYLLKNQGHKIIGIHFITGYETPAPSDLSPSDSLNRDGFNKKFIMEMTRQQMSGIEDLLNIHIEIIDCSSEFQQKVIDYFTRTYKAGLTPNPCMVCNQSIKFGLLQSFAQKLGATSIATGHYARLKRDAQGKVHLLKALDSKKDQSYFLAFLNQDQIATANFPLGEMKKSEVKKLAYEKGLVPITDNESQDVCFIKDSTYGDFLIRHQGLHPKPGSIKDIAGNTIGRHNGLHLFTVGQRRGINCPASEPYYVVKIDITHNRLIVGFKKDLLSSECRVKNINWIIKDLKTPTQVYTRIRYRNRPTLSTLVPIDKHTVTVKFANPQTAITPGQGAVFYSDDEILGGGWIDKTKNPDQRDML